MPKMWRSQLVVCAAVAELAAFMLLPGPISTTHGPVEV
jgi:hypothetical protein